MAITTRDGLVAAIGAGRRVSFFKATATSVAGFNYALFRVAGQPGANTTIPTTTGNTCTRTTTGALNIQAPATTSYITSYEGVSSIAGTLMVADRLVEFGGLSGITATAQTVSALALPSRATGALDVELWLEVYTAVGATASATVTCSYTNQAGTASRTATLIGGIPASGGVINRSYQFTLQSGDTGVQTVESFTSTTSTGTAGSLGLVLRRTLVSGPIPAANIGFFQGWAETDMQLCGDDACLELLVLASTTTTGNVIGNVGVSQG